MSSFAAVDLGASSGRVMVGRVEPDGEASRIELTEVHRFPNEPVRVAGTLHWDILALYRGVQEGLGKAGPVDSIGIDSWAVDYGLLDATGALLGNPIHYRDGRTGNVRIPVGDERLYEVTGLQKLPFNTLYQLVAAQGTPQFEQAQQMLLIPDLIAYWLTGELGAEYTNASTTELVDVRTRDWSLPLISELGLKPSLFPPIRRPGSTIGEHRDTPVVAVGSHDTASAVVGVPAADDRFAYISCGTWSLVGLELPEPVLTAASRTANFTNEGGVDGTIRFLRNVMGLWPLQECMREWGAPDITRLLRDASKEKPFAAVVDLDDPIFMPPGDMTRRLIDAAGAAGDASPATVTRCILDSLALAHRRAVQKAQELSGRTVDAVHIVGGGARNALLCQLTADACELPVLAGPVEATALGNVLVQARAAGILHWGLAALRSVLRDTQQIVRYEPRGHGRDWRAAEARLAAEIG